MSVDNISRAGELVPSRYAVPVGDIEVLVISDGVLPITASTLATTTPRPNWRVGWTTSSYPRRRRLAAQRRSGAYR